MSVVHLFLDRSLKQLDNDLCVVMGLDVTLAASGLSHLQDRRSSQARNHHTHRWLTTDQGKGKHIQEQVPQHRVPSEQKDLFKRLC